MIRITKHQYQKIAEEDKTLKPQRQQQQQKQQQKQQQ